MTALLILVGWQAFTLLVLLLGARYGVVTIAVRRPPAPRKETGNAS